MTGCRGLLARIVGGRRRGAAAAASRIFRRANSLLRWIVARRGAVAAAGRIFRRALAATPRLPRGVESAPGPRISKAPRRCPPGPPTASPNFRGSSNRNSRRLSNRRARTSLSICARLAARLELTCVRSAFANGSFDTFWRRLERRRRSPPNIREAPRGGAAARRRHIRVAAAAPPRRGRGRAIGFERSTSRRKAPLDARPGRRTRADRASTSAIVADSFATSASMAPTFSFMSRIVSVAPMNFE